LTTKLLWNESNYANRGPVVQGRVAAPLDALIWRELAGALAFEEENALAESVVVVMAAAYDLTGSEE